MDFLTVLTLLVHHNQLQVISTLGYMIIKQQSISWLWLCATHVSDNISLEYAEWDFHVPPAVPINIQFLCVMSAPDHRGA